MRKTLLITLSITAFLLLSGYLFLRFSLQTSIHKEEKKTGKVLPTTDTLGGKKVSAVDLRPLFIKRLQQLVKHSSHGLYDLSVGDMKVDLPASKVSLLDVTIQPNADSLANFKKAGIVPEDVFNISFKSLAIEGINLDDAISGKTMDYQLVKLVNPVIHINYYKKEKKKEDDEEEFSQRFLNQMQKLDVKQLIVEGGTVVIHDAQKNKTNKLNDVRVNLKDILLDSTTRKDKQRFLFAKEATISFRNYSTRTKDGVYDFKIGNVSIKVPQQQVALQNLSFISSLGKEQFEKRQKFRMEFYQLTIPSVTMNKVNWWNLVNEEEVVADELAINGGKLSVYFDRSLPPTSKMGNFPNQLLMKLPLKMNIAKLKIRNFDVAYEERNPVSQQSGTIYMDDVTMDASNVSNFRDRNKKPVTVNASALFMHRVPLQVRFSFDMKNYKAGEFTATVSSSGAFGGETINSFAMPLGLVKIEKGTMQNLQANIKGNELGAGGEVVMQYKDLKLTLLEKDQGETALDKKGFTTFIANAFVLKKDNPEENKEPRKEAAEFKRDPTGGFFMLVWKTLLVGALRTIGAPTKIAYKKPKITGKK